MFLHWIFVCLHIEGIFGHGKLWEPPSRSSMWRRGFHTPMNANDNELNCGGYEVRSVFYFEERERERIYKKQIEK